MTNNEVDLEALAVLQAHQLWRRGGDGPATDPTELGKAIDSVICELTARRARDADVEALVAADLELNRAIEAAGGFVEEGYEAQLRRVWKRLRAVPRLRRRVRRRSAEQGSDARS